MEKINQRYQELCTMLGDVEVKLKGLGNQKTQLFAELTKLDEQAAVVMQEMSAKKEQEEKEKAIAHDQHMTEKYGPKETGETKGI